MSPNTTPSAPTTRANRAVFARPSARGVDTDSETACIAPTSVPHQSGSSVTQVFRRSDPPATSPETTSLKSCCGRGQRRCAARKPSAPRSIRVVLRGSGLRRQILDINPLLGPLGLDPDRVGVIGLVGVRQRGWNQTAGPQMSGTDNIGLNGIHNHRCL